VASVETVAGDKFVIFYDEAVIGPVEAFVEAIVANELAIGIYTVDNPLN
jgi:hypothetical protein